MKFWLNIPMQETLLVHEALVQSGGIQELASMLQSKGILTSLDRTEVFKVTNKKFILQASVCLGDQEHQKF